jgi:hypothetical protein
VPAGSTCFSKKAAADRAPAISSPATEADFMKKPTKTLKNTRRELKRFH